MTPTKEFGRYLKECRESKGLTQQAVANRLGYTSPQFISNWERAISRPPPDSFPKVRKVLSIKNKVELFVRWENAEVDVLRAKLRKAYK